MSGLEVEADIVNWIPGEAMSWELGGGLMAEAGDKRNLIPDRLELLEFAGSGT